MASLVLAAAGAAIGGSIGGSILGVSAATIGGFIGSAVGSTIDSMLIASLQPDQRIEGARLESLTVTSSTEGAVVPRLYGRMRLGGNIIWATDFREKKKTKTQGGGKGGGGKVTTTDYRYFASFAVALCEGPITGIGRIWADGNPMDISDVAWRWHSGSETQLPDPLIVAAMGAADTPAYRDTAYVVFEDLALGTYGNRLPQLSFEVFRPLADPDTAEGLTRAVTMIPASGEFIYATEPIRAEGAAISENAHALAEVGDMDVSLDRLEAMAPKVESVSLVVAWFGNDLRAGACTLRPGVEVTSKTTKPRTWSVNGVSRGAAHLVSRDEQDRPLYGGTPADFAVVQAIQEMKRRGLRVTFYPFILMDIPADNTLPDPYSANASGIGQPAFPWRGRITCSPAAGYAGTVDKKAAAASQVTAFFGAATPSDFAVTSESVAWTGSPSDWGLRRMALHYAHLCAAAGGVDAFLIGSELRGPTTIRSGASSYPAVQALRDLAADVRAILGSGTKISYAADWSEYFGHQPQDGSNDVFFHLDPLWADPEIDFVGIDNYMPLSDWRDGFEHLDAEQGWPTIYDRGYLQANVQGGEGFDWYYASDADRAAQVRTPITDTAEGKPWMFRYKDIRSWWSNPHYNRPGGVESGSPTAWTPEAKRIRFTEFGCPAIDRGTNQPNVFVDPKSSESFAPYFSRGWRDDAIQRAYLEAFQLYWNDPGNNPSSGVYSGRMIETAESAAWTWDARPYPFFPALSDVWTDGANWRLGHWLTGRLGAASLAALVRHLCVRAGLDEALIDVSGLHGAVEGYAITALESPRASLAMLARHFGFDACESEGLIRFSMREGAAVATIDPDGMVPASAAGDVMELTRAQETELPQALKWQMARADEDYAPAVVEARRINVQASRVMAESFAVAVPPEEAERRCRRALMEVWVGRETAAFRLPPSRLALDPGDRVRLVHDGRAVEMRIASIADGEARMIEAIAHDRAVLDRPPGAERPARPGSAPVVGSMTAILMNLPRLREDMPEHTPLLAAYARPWPGDVAVYKSPSQDEWQLFEVSDLRASIGTLATDFYSGPAGRLDHGNSLEIDMPAAELTSVTDLALFAGANAFAVETAPGVWEVLQAGLVELVAPERYRLTRLLRGQRGTGWAIGAPKVDAGARIVSLDDGLLPLAIEPAELGLALNWRIGPASRAITSDTYAAQAFTPIGAGLRPFAPTHVRQPWRWPRTPGDLAIAWVPRTRSLLGDSWGAAEVPLEEVSEAYEVDILDGAAVLRTLASATTTVTYSAAAQIADWGVPLEHPDTLDVAICQISATYGRGAPCRATLFF